jgi:diguanylate cyclase (GGDEF)-like protein
LSKNSNKHIGRLISLVLGLAALLLFVTYKLTQLTNERSIAPYTEVFVDLTSELLLDDIQSVQAKSWLAAPDTMSFGITEHPHWLKAKLPANNSGKPQIIEFSYSLIDYVDIWFVTDKDGSLVILEEHSVGDAMVYSERPVDHDRWLFSIPETPQDVTLIARIQSTGPLKGDVNIWSKESYIAYISAHRLFMGVFFGYMFAMALSNLFLYVSTRIPTFLVYSGYVIMFATVIASLQGISYRFLWPESTWLQERAVALFSYIMLGLVVLFSRQILELDQQQPKLSKVLSVLQQIYFVLAAMCLVLPYSVMIKILLVMMLLSIPILLFVSITMAFQGSQIARFFAAAWGVLLLSGIMTSADSFQWLDFPIDASYVLMVGATIETLLLALALAMNFDNQREKANQARLKILESEKETARAKDELLKMQQEAKEQLEYAVDERTLELEIALRELSEVNNELEALSSIDALTGLMNRRAFEKRILAESRRSRRERTPLAVAMLDIDHFKKVNDTYGHQAGDECLRVFAKLMQETIKRPSDVLCRYGGEEFVVILPNTTLDGAKTLMEQLRIKVSETSIEFESKQITITTSAGVTARVVSTDNDHELMVSYADKQLYNAKDGGRNQVVAANF